MANRAARSSLELREFGGTRVWPQQVVVHAQQHANCNVKQLAFLAAAAFKNELVHALKRVAFEMTARLRSAKFFLVCF